MTQLRKNVEGWMGRPFYEGLGEEPYIEKTWRSLRDIVGRHLFDSEFVPVPFIETAAYYNQLFVFTKKQSVSIKIDIHYK